VVRSGWYLRGPETLAFERELAAFVGGGGCVGVANGTDALELALRGVGVAEGEVITAANAGGYATTAILRVGARPWYADVDADTLCLAPAAVERALANRRAGAVIVTHLYGQMALIEDIVALCRARGVAVVEDCAQAVGAERGGRRAGSFGNAAAFSFYPTKNLGAVGDAGAVIAADPAVEQRVRSLAQYGWEGKYRVALEGGRNSRLDEIQAAVLRVGLPEVEASNARRRAIVARYAAALSAPAGRFIGSTEAEYVGHLAVAVLRDRSAAQAHCASHGIETAVHYPVPDHRQPAWAGLDDKSELPVTEDAAAHILSLPLFATLTDAEVARVCEVLHAL
jgi:dTDP-4-amino-4,6-dideoxygalactose transaminase